MLVTVKNNKQISLQRFQLHDINDLLYYLQNLGEATTKRFGPHKFDRQTIIDLFQDPQQHIGYIAKDVENGNIIAYAIIKRGFLNHDAPRLQSYGLLLSNDNDCTFAPSVADAWQGLGVGNMLFSFIAEELRQQNIHRIILWGGVQKNNERAVNYYLRLGFKIVGEFEYYGYNLDMTFIL